MNDLDEIFSFCDAHKGADPAALRLKYLSRKEQFGFDVDLAISQLECRRKVSSKLRDFLARNPRWIFPGSIQAEQASGDITARFHASLVPEGSRAFDLTCGLGIDDFYISSRCSSLITCEISERAAELARRNFSEAGARNVTVLHADSMAYLSEACPADSHDCFDIIFADPARRDGNGRRVFAFEDCSPDIVAGFDSIRRRCRRFIVKGSPMMDISAVCRQLKDISHIYVVSVRNECREIVCVCDFTDTAEDGGEASSLHTDGERGPLIHALNFLDSENVQSLSGLLFEPAKPEPILDSPGALCTGAYLALPNASILKSGRTDLLQAQFPAPRLSVNTNIYLFGSEPVGFPGRVFLIEEIFSLHDRALKSLKGEKFNILTRNFPLSPEMLKKKLRTADGSLRDYLIGASAAGKPLIFKARLL